MGLIEAGLLPITYRKNRGSSGRRAQLRSRLLRPCLGVVGDAREQPAHLDGGRQLALLLVGGTDRGGIGFLETTNMAGSMEMHAAAGKPIAAIGALVSFIIVGSYCRGRARSAQHGPYYASSARSAFRLHQILGVEASRSRKHCHEQVSSLFAFVILPLAVAVVGAVAVWAARFIPLTIPGRVFYIGIS